MWIIVANRWLPKRVVGMTLFPFIFVKTHSQKEDATLIRHERIHIRQQIELLVVFFYIWYMLEFLFRWAKLRNRELAYRAISFEREAYLNESDVMYLKKRKLFAFIRYL